MTKGPGSIQEKAAQKLLGNKGDASLLNTYEVNLSKKVKEHYAGTELKHMVKSQEKAKSILGEDPYKKANFKDSAKTFMDKLMQNTKTKFNGIKTKLHIKGKSSQQKSNNKGNSI